jgi:septal ring factor EnvC (AmiA/AmiB activator)
METNVEKLMKNTKKQLVELYLKAIESDDVQNVERLKDEVNELATAKAQLEAEYKTLECSYNNAIADCKGTAERNNELTEEIDELATKLVTLQKDHRDLTTTAWCLGGIALAMLVVVFIML